MVEVRPRKRLCTPASVLIIACLVSLVAGILFGKRLAEQNATSRGNSVLLQGKGSGGSEGRAQQRPLTPICLNTCAKARNGLCEDGRVNNTEEARTARNVWCDLGTDCDDCGPWMPSGPVHWTEPDTQGPIGLLVAKGISVRVKSSSTTPPFSFAYTDPQKDFDVSSFFDSSGMIERSITKIFHHIFRDGCAAPKAGAGAGAARAKGAAGSSIIRAGGGFTAGAASAAGGADASGAAGAAADRALFVDVGANFGWFSLLAASLGCRALAFEPVPHFHAFFEYSAHLNGFMQLIDISRLVVANASDVELEVVAPSKGIWGTAGIGGLNIDPAIRGNENERLMIKSVALDDAVKEDVLLMKVDVEGWEWSVMQGAQQLLARHRVDNIIMEYSPGVPERHFRFEDIISTVKMLQDLVAGGYKVGHIGEVTKHGGGGEDLDSPLEMLEEVTAANLAYDMRDAETYAQQKLGCPIPVELRKYKAWVPQCGLALPEDVSPLSLRSMIGHNTNVWAAKNSPHQKLEGTVGILKLGADPKQYFVPEGSIFGMGYRFCQHMEPAVQVRHRCHCTAKEVCGEEEALITRLVNEGKIASNYRLPVNP